MNTPATPDPQSQEGAVLAIGLMLLLVVSMLATSGMTNATLEVVKSDSGEVTDNAFFAAENGIENALIHGDFSHTRGSSLPPLSLADGSSADTTIRYLGLALSPDESNSPGLVEYHFLVESRAMAARAAKSAHALQVMVMAPLPADPAVCLSAGCDIPGICLPDPVDCQTLLHLEPVRVAWHVSEDQP